MLIDAEKQHGQIVWAKMRKTSKLWAAIILSAKKMDLVYFEDKPRKTCVWWFSDDTMSQLPNDLIFEFTSNIQKGIADIGARKENFEQAIFMLSLQFNFDFPKLGLVNWALKYLPVIMKGKKCRKEEFIIPDQFLRKIKMVNDRIKRTIEDNNVESNPPVEKMKIDVSQISKMVNRYCIACRFPSDELKIKHPLFKGFLCNDCFINGKDIILSIAEDKSNDGCCVCLTKNHKLALCDFCIRAYCYECLEFNCEQKALDKILNDNAWACIACSSTTSTTSKTCNLVSRSTKEQLQNIYMLYPAKDKKDCTNKPYEIKEIHVMNLNDIQNNVPLVLQTLGFPYKILETNYVDENNNDNDKTNAKLVLEYYPNRENYNKHKFFGQNDCIKKFLAFVQFKNKMQALQEDGELFWAFETSAAIKVEEKAFISKFLELEPIIISMDTNDIHQRSRFIWTNITIFSEDIRPLTNQNIYLYDIPKPIGRRSIKDRDMPWCYSSVYTILSSLIKNDIL